MLTGDEDGRIPTNHSPDNTSNMTFLPMTSVDVKSSLSLYKHILSDKRTRITPENMKQYIVINCVKRDT